MPPSAAEVTGYEGLHAAAAANDPAAIRTLAAQGAAMEARDGAGRTALHVATFLGRHEAIRALIGAGADANALEGRRYDPVTIAAVANDEPTLDLLIELGASARNITSPYDGTALIAAAHLGQVGVVRRLIAAGAPLDHVNNLHWTALIEAVVLGDGGANHAEVVRLLLDAGANRALTDRGGRTALDLARARGFAAMVRLLEALAR